MDGFELIKAADETTLAQCLKARRDVFTAEMNVPPELETDENDVLHGICEHFLLRLNGENAGALRCRPENGNAVRLQRFCVYKRSRGLGIGRAAVSALEKLYSERGVLKLVLDAKLNAAGFYEKCGFSSCSDVFIEAGVPHIAMTKSI